MSRPKADEEDTTLRSSWLITHAAQLVTRMSDTGLPRTAHPRRAVSAAYYALFHKVTVEVAYSAIPESGQRAWWQLCRGFTHGGISLISKWLTTSPCPTSVSGLVGAARTSDDLVDFATLFLVLREERERADYSHEVVIDKRSAQAMVDSSTTAIAALDAVGDGEAWRAFVALMLMKSDPRAYHLPGGSSSAR